MELTYHILRTTEILVMYIGGFRLITQGFPLRWDKVWAKGILAGCYGAWLLLLMDNAWNWFKFSGVEYALTIGVSVFLIFIFFKMSLLTACVHSILFWQNMEIFHFFMMCIATMESGSVDKAAYNTDYSALYISEVAGMAISVSVVAFLLWLRKGKRLIMPDSKKEEFLLLFLLILEFFLCNGLGLPGEMISKRWTFFAFALLFALIVSVALAFAVYHAYQKERAYEQQVLMTNQFLESQYEMLQMSYHEKRTLLHDIVQRNILLKGYLDYGQYDKAKKFLSEMQEDYINSSVMAETGILEIDLILHYKRKICEREHIQLETKMDVLSCPLQNKDICVLLGNLLDNAIEAAREVEEDKRKIVLHMKSLNRMFMIQLCNPYREERKVVNGRYLTTKERREHHGVGLASCRRIVESYGGDFEIANQNRQFTVTITMMDMRQSL